MVRFTEDWLREREARKIALKVSGSPQDAFLPPDTSSHASERDLHDGFEAWLRSKGYLWLHSRMDMAATIAVGWPDYSVFLPGGIAVFVEFKRPKCKPTIQQLAKLAGLRKLGFTAEICNSVDRAKELCENAMKSIV